MFLPESASINIEYYCENCGAEGEQQVAGDVYLDNTFGVDNFECPICGETLEEEE